MAVDGGEGAGREALRVLVVEDDPDFRATLQAFLESRFPHWDVVTAATPAEGLSILRRGSIHAVVSDYDMPAMDGLQLLAAVQAIDPAVPRVLLTAHPDREAQEARRRRLVSDVIPKLASPDELARRIEAACSRRDPGVHGGPAAG